ncbi:MAG: hypothetical protein HPY58_12580 [Firmicutes bacterium]|nr:hypothetical protein [Bacillota bacterium]
MALIKYCVEKELINQAVLLGREWLISCSAWQVEEERWRNRDVHERKLVFAAEPGNAPAGGRRGCRRWPCCVVRRR